MARYRLRFLLQEFDLPHGATVIGRSLDCNLTIEDPLVSRAARPHRRSTSNGERVEDMGSRNGVRVNGVQIKRPDAAERRRPCTNRYAGLRLLPRRSRWARAHSKTTGVLRLCSKCHLPYPRESVSCPNCEATEQPDEETLSGCFGYENQTSWSVQLLVEALERALSLGRVQDAERIARRATAQVEELARRGGAVDPKALAAARHAGGGDHHWPTNDPTWVLWVLDIYRRTDRVPPLGARGPAGRGGGEARGGGPRRPRSACLSTLDGLAPGTPPRSMSRPSRGSSRSGDFGRGSGPERGRATRRSEWPRPS